jgi:hypothetical protein
MLPVGLVLTVATTRVATTVSFWPGIIIIDAHARIGKKIAAAQINHEPAHHLGFR